ncbi:hypothetical protein EXV95_06880 [Acidovorax sp. JMULE5]|uniref:hypothetical protein n=1 Tax=Acidovorax sp. JMULE5 TaxID=2518343 RepID=UPI0015A3014B|nr:hypothetical protein [Acidovorax sp. JMULE5]QLA80385.1 hypothetical protein EXV95_06880 [Acidovorax sp. JMULE5]
MSRKPSGSPEDIRRALDTAETTQSATELRRVLAVVLPVLHGLSLKQTASLVGRSETWVAKERQNFIQNTVPAATEKPFRGSKNHLIPADEEDAFMATVCQKYIRLHTAWRLGLLNGPITRRNVEKSFVEVAHEALEERIQRKTTRTTVYNLLERAGKRRFANYEPYLWELACRNGLPSSWYDNDEISAALAKRYGLSRKKPRAPK